jgi:hypothetical protein
MSHLLGCRPVLCCIVFQIDGGEVEMWIVDAIAQGLLEASIDQLNDSITIT